MRHALTTLTAALAITAPAAAAGPVVPTILPAHHQAGKTGWPHPATMGEMREATRTVHRYTRHLLPPGRRAIRTLCWTGREGWAGRYACQIRNARGGTTGIPRVYRAAVLQVWEDGSWELTYRGRRAGTVTYTQAPVGRASSATYTPVKCCTADRSR